ncbi:hypothetical protein Tco_0678458 [Tanacetum coccineum]|uniref:Uncharacterized protein n=1 Tax=Tanacetum coccineum TaxID=301880 RepID=A0ABQ4XF51_9ASTR
MTIFPEISRRARDAYYNLQDDDIMKHIFNLGRNKNKVGMRILTWMITVEMKLIKNYKMYADVFGLDVPLIQSQPTESTQRTHRTTSAPRSPNPDTEPAESTEKANEMILQDTIQVSLAEHKSREEQEARENVVLVDEHLAAEEIEKLVENPENVNDSSPPRHDDTSIPGTRLEPSSDKESPEVGIVQEKEEETRKTTEVEPDIVIPINVDDEEEEITDEVFELRRRVKGKNVEESRILTIDSSTRSPRNFSTLNSAKRAKDIGVDYVSGDSHLEQENAEELGPLSSIPTKQVSQDIMEEISLTIDKAKLKKMADEMLRQRCTSGDEHQYHIDQMKNFLQSDIVWENPEAPALSLINQDLLYLKKGNSGPKKIVLSLHKFPAIVFDDDDIKERTSRWVNKYINKFNPYARYGVENWKNPHAKIFYIRRQKEPGRPKEEIYSNSKIVQVIKTFWELGHEHKFITKIVARRANGCIVSITEPDYKNLNKNDIEDMYLLIMNNKINLTAPTITFPGIEEHDVFSIVYKPVHGIIYTNSKNEKRVMRPSEIHKFCDATLRRTLEGLKSYYNDVKYGYVQIDLTNDEVEFLKLFKEEIEVRLNYRDQMRR